MRVAAVDALGPDLEPERLEFKRRGVSGAVMHGLFAGGHLLGYLELDRMATQDFTEAAAPAAASVAAILASALQRERSDAALRASEDRAKALLAGLPDALLRLSADGRILDARFPKDEKPLAQPLLGLGLAQLPSVWKGLPTSSGLQLQAALQTALRTGRPQSVDLELGQGDSVRYLECRILPQGASEATALLRDRTMQRREEMEHERQLGNLLAIFNAGSRGLMLLDADGSLQAFNQAAARSAIEDMGVKLQAGMRLEGKGHPVMGEAMGRQFAQALKGEEPEMEQDFPLPGGRSRLMRVQHLPVFGEDGGVRAVCISFEYLDRLKQTQDALKVSEERYALAALGSKDGLWDLDLRAGRPLRVAPAGGHAGPGRGHRPQGPGGLAGPGPPRGPRRLPQPPGGPPGRAHRPFRGGAAPAPRGACRSTCGCCCAAWPCGTRPVSPCGWPDPRPTSTCAR